MYKIVTLEEVSNQIDSTQPLAFDTETDGFYGTIEVGQFYQKQWPEVLLVLKPNPYELANLLTNQHFVGHMVHYDITTIQQQTGTTWIPNHFDCTFYLSRLYFYKQHAFSLDDVIQYTIGYDPYEQANIEKKQLQKSTWSGELTEAQLMYAALDVYYLIDVYEKTNTMLEDFNYKLDILFTKNCLDFQWNGMPVIEEALQDKYYKNLEEIELMDMPVNVNSWKQVRPYIGEEESDALALTKFKLQGNTRAGNVLKTRKIIKENSFLKKFDAEDKRIYGKFLPSARSGRCTSKDQNLEQIPRSTKDVFGFTPDDNKVIIYADYSQLELRGVCVITGETRMEALYRQGADLHGHTTERTVKKDYDDKERHVGKTANFNLVYGGSANMLNSILIKDAEILLPIETISDIKNKWHRLWPTLTEWQRKGISAWRHEQAWQTPLGRRYVGNLMTDQLNIQIQGFGAEVAKLATHYMSKELGGLTFETHQLDNFIHDSWIWEADNDPELCKYLADVIAHSMQEAWFECCKSVKIKDLPMPVDVFIGYNWGRIEKDYLEKYTYE